MDSHFDWPWGEVTIRKKGGVNEIHEAMKQHAGDAAVQERGRRSLKLVDADSFATQ